MSTQPLLQRTATKRIALPVRVEPKVSFANERTFLSWLHFTVVLGGLAVGLLNFGDKVNSSSAVSNLPAINDLVRLEKLAPESSLSLVSTYILFSKTEIENFLQQWPSWYMHSIPTIGGLRQFFVGAEDHMTTGSVR